MTPTPTSTTPRVASTTAPLPTSPSADLPTSSAAQVSPARDAETGCGGPEPRPADEVSTGPGRAGDAGAPSDPDSEASQLAWVLAGTAVRRDPRTLRSPLDTVAPWARALPPAAWRTFAAEVGAALEGDDPQSLPGVLRRWAAVADRFA
ncbi:MAG: hypothetical protein IPK37_02270 [Austwickia sp.]|nr:MAG: hypothetical protein IPK37_02270 [Austwickia sp.]